MTFPSPLSILFVDDNPSERIMFREILREINPAIVFSSANDGVSAIKQLTSEEANTPDIIFLDFNMPGMNGIETLKAIKEYEPLSRVPVVMYSTGDVDAYKAQAKVIGAVTWLQKSINMDMSAQEVKFVIDLLIASHT